MNKSATVVAAVANSNVLVVPSCVAELGIAAAFAGGATPEVTGPYQSCILIPVPAVPVVAIIAAEILTRIAGAGVKGVSNIAKPFIL